MKNKKGKKTSASAERIRKAYEKSNEVSVEVIPAREKPVDDPDKVWRVCAYCRVSTDEESQQSSYELQVQHYTEYISGHKNWVLHRIYADEGISGTAVRNRKHFLEMIEDCKAGKIDLIITKSISRFARNIIDCIAYVRELKQMTPPIGVIFETEGFNTLDSTSEMVLAVLSALAQEESVQKSNSLKWSYQKRFKKGIPVNNMWAVLGYDTDKDGNIFIVEKEAEIVRYIFRSYAEGKSTSEIAEALTQARTPTPKEKSVWSPGTITGMLHNEKYCGDMRMQKTVSVDIFNHKVAKNDGIANQYLVKDYHPAIVSRSLFDKVQRIFQNGGNKRTEKKFATKKVKLKPIKRGRLQGFIPIPANADSVDIEQLTAKIKIKK